MPALSRRSFLAASLALPAASARKPVPVGLELYSVRDELTKDLRGTVTAVAKMGYQEVEFYSPYLQWTLQYAKEVRKLLDDLGIRCPSTHNGANAFDSAMLNKAMDLNDTLGSKIIVMAGAGNIAGLDGWKTVAHKLTVASAQAKAQGMRVGFHNHQVEFQPIDGKRPIEVLAANTPKSVVLQLDVGTAVEVGADPVAWIKANPGRIVSIHCKDWGRKEGYHVLFGEGDAPWKNIFQAAESVGGVEHYLIEQEGSRLPPIETAQRCLENWKKLRA